MVMAEDEFRREFPGESEHLEFKQGTTWKKIQEAAVAFSNGDGGVIFVGVAPDGRITGVTDPGERAREVHQAIQGVSNPGRYEVHELTVGANTLLVISVERRKEGFAQTSEGVVRIRRGASNPPLMGTDLSRFVAERAFESFENTPTALAPTEADPALLDRLVTAYDWRPEGWRSEDVRPLLREAGFVSLQRREERLTVVGALLLLVDPSRIGCRAFIDIRRYREGEQEPDRTWTVSGSAAEQIERATADILREVGSSTAVLGVQRVDMPKLPPRAVREAVANAVAHRSYQNAGSAVRIEIHSDRVRITSPGGLPEPVTVEHIRVQQAARNRTLLDALHRMGLAEDLGRGIDRIEDDMVADLLQLPEFEDDQSFFTVTLRLVGTFTPLERAWVRQLIDRDQLDARSAPVVVEAARRGAITNSDVRALLGIDSVDARNLLQRLVAERVFEQRGERAGTVYVVAASAGAPVHVRHTVEELAQMVLVMAEEGPITNALVRDRTGLDRMAALNLLQRLVTDGRLQREGTRRGTRYSRASA
ncbi:MAG TPA: ATP-binding protein [Acidimicrobiales bacterium]|nr:ATP-binding protein [Acidimicrobiales bacterium]